MYLQKVISRKTIKKFPGFVPKFHGSATLMLTVENSSVPVPTSFIENNISSEVLPVHPSDEEQQERLFHIFTAVDLRGDGVGQLVIQLLNHHHIVIYLA
jgi:hypothetical protein